MGRARQQLRSITVAKRRDSFAAVLGSGRGVPLTQRLASGGSLVYFDAGQLDVAVWLNARHPRRLMIADTLSATNDAPTGAFSTPGGRSNSVGDGVVLRLDVNEDASEFDHVPDVNARLRRIGILLARTLGHERLALAAIPIAESYEREAERWRQEGHAQGLGWEDGAPGVDDTALYLADLKSGRCLYRLHER